MQEEFQQLTPYSFSMVYLGQPELMDNGDMDIITKNFNSLMKTAFYSFLLGVTANV